MKQEPAESALVETKPGFLGILALFFLRAGRMHGKFVLTDDRSMIDWGAFGAPRRVDCDDLYRQPQTALQHRRISLCVRPAVREEEDRKSTRLNSSHGYISYAVFCLKKKTTTVCRWRQAMERPDGFRPFGGGSPKGASLRAAPAHHPVPSPFEFGE